MKLALALFVGLAAVLMFATTLAQANDDAGDLPELKIHVLHTPDDCKQKSKMGKIVSIQFKGTLEDGSRFDSSYDSGEPFKFQIGVDQVIKGWHQGLLDMCIKEIRRLTIPPQLAYGYGERRPGTVIPEGSTLIFDIELLAIQEGSAPANLFKYVDQNGDMKISRDEMMFLVLDHFLDEFIEERFNREDVDQDGFISYEEFSGPKREEL